MELTNDDWQDIGHKVPLLANLQPAGEYLGEDYYKAGGVPAVVCELIEAKLLPHPSALTVNGKSIGENCQDKKTSNSDVIKSCSNPILKQAGFLNLKGNLFESAILKTSVISEEFIKRYLSNPKDPMAFEGRAVVFDGPEQFHDEIDNEEFGIDENSILVMRGTGPKGYPGAAEVVNMRPPAYLLQKGIRTLACIGDGRQSGTSGSPSILNASPEAADGGGLALLETGDIIRIDLNKCSVDMLVEEEIVQQRLQRLNENGGYKIGENQSPWQEIFRDRVEQLKDGMVLKNAPNYRGIVKNNKLRHNH